MTIIAFILTGILGGCFSAAIAIYQKDLDRAQSARSERKATVQALSRYIYERRVRSELLSSSLRRNSSIEELRERKKNYDDSYVKWNTEIKANLFAVRHVLGEREYGIIENYVEVSLVLKSFKPIDACLTKAYDLRIAGADPMPTLDSCDMKALLGYALDCGYALTDELYKLSDAMNVESVADLLSKAEGEISSRCPRS
ncbi:hypothetical protein [Azospirillum argentinense]|uniref:hypothetical protein n=1 Tax=Azospirillum argentinense TaxID=2970906 RepID=UPI0010C039DD|nr:hypothetical protein [Azospirillum argentinense]